MAIGNVSPSTVIKGGRWKLLRWLLVSLIVAAVVVIARLEPDEDDLFELCSTQGKPRIYRSAVAQGYFHGLREDCWGCWNYLENTDYTFVEFKIGRQRKWGPIGQVGTYRASRINAKSNDCSEKLTSHYRETQWGRDQLDRGNWCLKLERLEAPVARYGYYYEHLGQFASSPISGTSISARRFYFIDHSTGETVAESMDFSLSNYPYIHLSSFRSAKGCSDYADRLGLMGLYRQDVIKTDMEHSQ